MLGAAGRLAKFLTARRGNRVGGSHDDTKPVELGSAPGQSRPMLRLSACLLAILVLAVIAVACGHFQPTAHPLYPGPARPSAELARLTGPIAKVDGADVSRLGGTFALLPGCHLVELRRKIGEGTVSGAWSAEIGHLTYAFRMRAGQSYEIDVRLQHGNSESVGNATVGNVSVEAVERDASGQAVASIPPVRKSADLEACQLWEEELAKAEPTAEASERADAGSAAGG